MNKIKIEHGKKEVQSFSQDNGQKGLKPYQTPVSKWPLDFKLKNWPRGTHKWWHHWKYRGLQDEVVEISYSKTKADSEVLAQSFLNEPILGFDMEWPWDSDKSTRLQQKVGLIQIASEAKIGLFHIGLHVGETPQDLIAPSLRKIIESPDIVKTGVNILKADFSRLEKWFDLRPRGAFELSHLHNLVTFGAEQPELLTTKLRALAKQVEEHLGLPQGKGSVRTSNWSKPLDTEQRTYAADDAYAGFMLYHCMNSKRTKMDPTPPLPRLAGTYITMATWPNYSIQLEPSKSGVTITAYQFYAEAKHLQEKEGESSEVKLLVDKENSEEEVPLAKIRDKSSSLKLPVKYIKRIPSGSTDADAPRELYDRLVKRRKALALAQSVPAFCVAANSVLEGLARLRPTNEMLMLKVKGIGKQNLSKYGADWIEVITQFITENGSESFGHDNAASAEELSPTSRITSETLEEGQPFTSVPQPHTGLSFSMASTVTEDKEKGETEVVDHSDSDDSSAFGVPLPALSAAALKRKRPRSPSEETTPIITSALGRSDQAYVKSRILTSKLTALARNVASQLNLKDADSVASDVTIRHIVEMQMVTPKELYRIPGILNFVDACANIGLDLFDIIVKFRG